jgi:signal transduction histidine kinase
VSPLPPGPADPGPRRTLALWSGIVALAAAAGAILALTVIDGRTRWQLAALAVGSIAAWALWGVRALRGSRTATAGYLSLLTVLLGAAVALEPNATPALFVLQPQVWLLTSTVRAGAAWSVTMTAVASGAALSTGVVDPAQLALVMSGTLVYGLLLGTWIARTRQRSAERAALLAELQNAQDRLAIAHREEGIVAERERMSREIHDTLAQGFLSIMAQARAASAEARRAGGPDAAPAGSAAVMDRLHQIETTARENLGEARSLVAVSAPHGLAESGLAATVTRLCERFAAESGVEATAAFGADPDSTLADIAPPTQVVVVRAVQEALANVRKHARATTVEVNLDRDGPDRLVLTVRDDGVGLATTPASAPVGSYGLAGLRDRVHLVGGTVEVQSAPDRGTSVRVVVPTIEEENR